MLCASEIAETAAMSIKDRAATRDTESGERSMARIVRVFNAATGHNLSEREGWIFQIATKLGRAAQGGHNVDDYIDLGGYAALAGESAEREEHT